MLARPVPVLPACIGQIDALRECRPLPERVGEVESSRACDNGPRTASRGHREVDSNGGCRGAEREGDCQRYRSLLQAHPVCR
jgi:hypothetical protein